MITRLTVIVLLLLVLGVAVLVNDFAGAAIFSTQSPDGLSCTAASCSCSALLSGINSSDNKKRYFARRVVYDIIQRKLGLGKAESLDHKTFMEQSQLLTTLCKMHPNAPMRDVAITFVQGK